MDFESLSSKVDKHEQYIMKVMEKNNVVEKVAALMKENKNFNEAFDLVLNSIGTMGGEKDKILREKVAKILGRRGSQRKETIKKTKSQPSKVFTKEQMNKIKKEAQLRQWREERRAGQTEEESGLV